MYAKTKFKAKCLLILLFCLIRLPVSMATESDFSFRWILPPEYYQGNDFHEGRAWVQKERSGPWKLIDDNGDVLKDGFEARGISKYREGLADYYRGNTALDTFESGYLDKFGNVVINVKNEGVLGHFGNNMTFKKGDNGLYGYVNIFTGEWEIQPIYEHIDYFEEGIALVFKDGKYGYIDVNGNNITEFVFNDAFHFKNGMAIVKIGDKFGLVNKKGVIVAEPIYDGFYSYYSDLVGFHKNGKVGFVDATGKTVIDFKFYSPPWHGQITEDSPNLKISTSSPLYSFNNGRAIVFDEDTAKHWVINEKGDLLFPFDFGDSGQYVFRGGFIVRKYGEETILYDVNGRRYNISPYLTPTSEVFLSDNGPFKAVDEKENKTGYFYIETDRDRRSLL